MLYSNFGMKAERISVYIDRKTKHKQFDKYSVSK
jgi:hypothetical protein